MSPAAPAEPQRRERKKQQTRDALVRAALRLFDAQGYDQTAVREITDAVDVSERTFFRYFASKEDLALSFARDATEALMRELARPAGRRAAADRAQERVPRVAPDAGRGRPPARRRVHVPAGDPAHRRHPGAARGLLCGTRTSTTTRSSGCWPPARGGPGGRPAAADRRDGVRRSHLPGQPGLAGARRRQRDHDAGGVRRVRRAAGPGRRRPLGLSWPDGFHPGLVRVGRRGAAAGPPPAAAAGVHGARGGRRGGRHPGRQRRRVRRAPLRAAPAGRSARRARPAHVGARDWTSPCR